MILTIIHRVWRSRHPKTVFGWVLRHLASLVLLSILSAGCASPQAIEKLGTDTVQATVTSSPTATLQPTIEKSVAATVPTTITLSPTATYPRPTEPLAFVSLQGKNALLYLVKSDGSDLKQVSSTVAWYVPNQQWSPDGSRLAFLTEYQGKTTLYITGKSNASPQRLTVGMDVRSYEWSPDGKEIAFAAIRGDVKDIYIVFLDTLNLVNLTVGSSGVNTEPKWSHDGKHMAFLAVPEAKNIKQIHGEPDYRLYIMDKNGANKRRVKPESPLSQEQLSECAPAWSPDDHYLAFNHGCLSVDPWNIYLFELQTGKTLQVTINGFDNSRDRWSVWLSNEQLLVRSFRPDVSGEHYRVMNRDGTNDHRLLPWDIENINLIDWTSDHRWFVWQEFEWGNKGTNEILIGDLTTKQVTRTGVKGCSPKWSPSGFWIAYTTECIDKEKSDLWIMDRTGKNQKNLTAQLQGINHFPVWAPK